MSIIERAAEKIKRSEQEKKTSEVSAASMVTPENNKDAGHENLKSTPALAGEKIQSYQDKSDAIGQPELIFKLNLQSLAQNGLIPPDGMRDMLEQEYRRIKRPLLSNITGRGAMKVSQGERIMITSSLEGEGKTFTAFNLARSLAQEQDSEVILIDADNVRQTLTKLLGLSERLGLLDALAPKGPSASEIVVRTDIERLFFVPNGTRTPTGPELLSGNRMEQLLTKLTASRPRILIFDTTPLLGTPEAVILSEAVGQILIVVKSGVTQRNAITAALHPLDRKKSISFILNQIQKSHGDPYNKYQYGYKYDA
ncbi:hypothetical protein BI364_11710 [Acidihalobacter yilgarnensis]|uniref:CobQ/CobB/MinD/ParA nucleotide binding domain-containing protein n=1 Tax=Acidihalobacter yilgarnensis TaxID=2819280 RepID=A0A1D8IPZ4_9GAMM|nr:AAA family ATPase [Acidihalobacter yilgarnensis]AOU98533.1 hypothetical protein BI364_11710 [Acidihalobacter yilgarnensis]